jgi:hypothetical protein
MTLGEFLRKLSCLNDERPEILALIAKYFQYKTLEATGRKALSIEIVLPVHASQSDNGR